MSRYAADQALEPLGIAIEARDQVTGVEALDRRQGKVLQMGGQAVLEIAYRKGGNADARNAAHVGDEEARADCPHHPLEVVDKGMRLRC